jgi:beta-lactamase class A
MNWRPLAAYSIGGLALLLIAMQFAYPGDRLLPGTKVDGIMMNGWRMADASWELDRRYQVQSIALYFGNNATPYRSPVAAEIGLQITNTRRIEAMHYPWWLKLVPTSLAWAHFVIQDNGPAYSHDKTAVAAYLTKELGHSCDVTPTNAQLVAFEGKITVKDAAPGGACQPADVATSLMKVTPKLTSSPKVRIAMKEVAPAVSTAAARGVAENLRQRIGETVSLHFGDQTFAVPGKEVIGWLDFTSNDNQVTPMINSDRAASYLLANIAPQVTMSAGVSKVTTYDFVETSRVNGAAGQVLNAPATLGSLQAYITGQNDTAAIVTTTTAPRTEYVRSYSPTDQGLSALMTNYAADHPGMFGVSMIELSGQHRNASYNNDHQFITASTYKLFVAYSTLKRIESGEWQWSDQIDGGRDLTKCFDDMIVKSDNACGVALLHKVGYETITSVMHAIGLTNTTFLKGDSPLTTPGNLADFLAALQSGQLLSPSSTDTLLSAMKRNVYRQGVPAGIPATVADKVGFLYALLHDASVVYSPSGTYVLVIMTDGSSWGTIADLAKKIDQLRAS